MAETRSASWSSVATFAGLMGQLRMWNIAVAAPRQLSPMDASCHRRILEYASVEQRYSAMNTSSSSAARAGPEARSSSSQRRSSLEASAA